jgi:hypothetical protein
MAKHKKYMVWSVHLPGHVYAYNAWLSEPGTAKDARAWMRDWLGVKRLPNGTAVWPSEG